MESCSSSSVGGDGGSGRGEGSTSVPSRHPLTNLLVSSSVWVGSSFPSAYLLLALGAIMAICKEIVTHPLSVYLLIFSVESLFVLRLVHGFVGTLL